jgi:integrase
MTGDELVKLLYVAQRRPLAEYGRLPKSVSDCKPANDPAGGRRGKWTYADLTFDGIDAASERARDRLRKSPHRIEQLMRLGRERALIYKTLVLTGLRRGELASLSIGQVHLDNRPAYLELDAADAKNREAAQIPLRRDLSDDLGEWIEDMRQRNGRNPDAKDGRVCLAMTGVPHTGALVASMPLFTIPDKLVRILDRDLRLAGIPKRDDRGRTLDVHALRHSFGTLLSKGGVAPRTAQAAMRHSTIDLTMNVYTDPRLLDLHQAVESLPDLHLNGLTTNRPRATELSEAHTRDDSQFAPTLGNLGTSESIAVKSADSAVTSPERVAEVANSTAAKRNDAKQRRKSHRKKGWLTGLEPVTPRSTIWCSNQLSYSHRT